MRTFIVVVGFCVAAAALLSPRGAAAGTSAIPADHSMYVGDWTCAVKLAAMEGMPSSTDTGAMTISMSPGQTMHSHVTAKDYMSDSYEGYNQSTKTFWISTADTIGDTTFETSTDHMVYTGTTWDHGRSNEARDTRSVLSGGRLRDITSLKMNGKWVQIADATCTKH